ncbi:MAG TPA: COX15/CtaA family protein [Terriglobales bacterium]|nr:COX15/CtaA family protein [Terriglobales bacterium]
MACATFLLLIAGALVTSNDAGLSVPDWPTSFGSLYKLPRMVGGVKFEHGHRMVAELVGLLTIILAVWTWRADRRGWVRNLGVAALATVIAQGILGGITVLFYLPPAVSTAHATLAQTFFCIVVVLALVTGRSWTEAPRKELAESHRLHLTALATLAAASVYVQLILGAGFRHSGIKLLPHLISAVVVTALVLWTITRVLTNYGSVAALRRPAVVLMTLLVTQLGLGFAAYLTRVQWGQDAVQPELSVVISTVAHVAVGALVLASTVVLTMQTWRNMGRVQQEREAVSPADFRKAVNA